MTMLRGLASFSILLALAATSFAQTSRGGLVAQSVAARHGLKRAWFTQVQIDRSSDRIASVVLHRDMLFVQTERGVIQAIESETGRTRWVAQIGRRDQPSLAPAVNDQYVATVSGSWLHIVERDTGKPVWKRQVEGGPGAGPALTSERVYVPMIDGMIESYLLDLDLYRDAPSIFASAGRALVQPLSTGASVSWPTDRGFLYVSRAENPGVRFRVETHGPINTQPAYAKPYIFGASHDGYLYAVHELSGNQLWRFSAGGPITAPPVAVKDRLFVARESDGMFCVAPDTGEELWWARGVSRFLAASPERVYGIDRSGSLYVLDAATGARLSTMRVPAITLAVVNSTSDRLYLGTETGLIQCLHDVTQSEPIYYGEPPPDADKPPTVTEQKGLDEAAAGDAPDGGDAPAAGGGDGPKPADDNPFGGDDNPFN